MPNIERTFADILGRAQQLSSAIASFQPPFAPADLDLNPASFAAFLDSVDVANAKVADRRTSYATKALGRVDLVKEVKARAQRALSYLKSNVAWKRHTESIKPTYEKLRGYRTAKTVVPSEPPADAEEKRKIKTGQQSFADIEGLFAKFYVSLTKVPGYAPTTPEISLLAMNQLDQDLKTLNDDLAGVAAEMAVVIKDRAEAYRVLHDRALAIKAAVSAQYGIRSSEYASIKGLRF